jgi:hypothetical protein
VVAATKKSAEGQQNWWATTDNPGTVGAPHRS